MTSRCASRGPKDTLSQVTNSPIGFAPVDGVPVGLLLGSVCRGWFSHLTFPLMNTLYLVLWVTHQDHVSRLSAWVSPFPALSAQLCVSVAFRLAAFASWSLPSPLRRSAFLAVGLLEVSTNLQTSLGLSRSACVRCNRGGCLLYCGSWVSFLGISAPTRTIAPFIIVSASYDDRDVTQPP